MSDKCNVQAMAEATYRKQCEFVGADHEGHCVKLLTDTYQWFEDEIERLLDSITNMDLVHNIALVSLGEQANEIARLRAAVRYLRSRFLIHAEFCEPLAQGDFSDKDREALAETDEDKQ